MRILRHPWHGARRVLRHHHEVPRGARRVSEGAEAFLDGSVGRYLQRSKGVVPAWTWVNVLAHADGAHLRRCCSEDAELSPRGPQWRRWRRATAVMAREILSLTAGSEDRLRALQRAVLQPLEERVAFGGRPVPWTPEHLTALVLEAAHGARPEVPRQAPEGRG